MASTAKLIIFTSAFLFNFLLLNKCFILCEDLVDEEESNKPIVLTDALWPDMLKDEWMVKFYAPWCPACRSLVQTWEDFAKDSKDLNVKVAQVDITAHPSLSGRFLVTALPTIYHIKDGEFRLYDGPRGILGFKTFISDKRWKLIKPMGWWRSPDSYAMTFVSWFFKAAVFVRDLHAAMTNEYGFPIWASYMIFAVMVIVCGLTLGLIIVLFIDFFFPPKPIKGPMRFRDRGHEFKDDTDDIVEETQVSNNHVSSNVEELRNEPEAPEADEVMDEDLPEDDRESNVRRRVGARPEADVAE